MLMFTTWIGESPPRRARSGTRPGGTKGNCGLRIADCGVRLRGSPRSLTPVVYRLEFEPRADADLPRRLELRTGDARGDGLPEVGIRNTSFEFDPVVVADRPLLIEQVEDIREQHQTVSAELQRVIDVRVSVVLERRTGLESVYRLDAGATRRRRNFPAVGLHRVLGQPQH